MISNVVYELLDTLAERYIPAGKHKYLHVDSREAWLDLMTDMVERDLVKTRLSTLTKCAMHWETLLVHKLSILN